MIVIDTSALIDCLAGARPVSYLLRNAVERGERFLLPSLVLFEWLRGPRQPAELAAQEALFPSEEAIVFGPREAAMSAQVYRLVKRPRQREIDLAIASTAIVREAQLWTLHPDDFSDIPNLRLTALR